MFDIIGRHNATIFLNASKIIPSPEIISSLLLMFQDKGFLPTTFQQVGPTNSTPQARLKLHSQNNEWGISFAEHRIDIEKNPVNKGETFGNVEDFTSDASDFLTRILRHFSLKGTRLAIVTSGLLKEMDSSQLDSVYKKLFNSIPLHNDCTPFEWNYRAATRSNITVDSQREDVNLVTSINRVQGKILESRQSTHIDRIEIIFDINTLSKNDEIRFSIESLNHFFAESLHLRKSILKDIMDLIDE